MTKNSYESGRLNLPFVGHCTFAKREPCTDWDTIDADVAILGIPYDLGIHSNLSRSLYRQDEGFCILGL